MSIVKAFDERIGSLEEEIRGLEEQLDGKRDDRDRLVDLRDQAAPLDGDGGGVASASAPSKSEAAKPKTQAKPSPAASRALKTRVDRIVAIVGAHPEGIKPRDLIARCGISKAQFQHVRHRVLEHVDEEGACASLRLIPKGTTNPERAPAPRRAAQVPVEEEEARTAATAEQGDRRELVKAAILDGLKDGAVGLERLKAAVLAKVTGADVDDFAAARRNLTLNRRIEVAANKLQLTGIQDNRKPITELEREVVEAVGSGRTAREIAANCPLLKGNAFTATQVLAALSHRGVIRRRPGQLTGEQAIYEQLSAVDPQTTKTGSSADEQEPL